MDHLILFVLYSCLLQRCLFFHICSSTLQSSAAVNNHVILTVKQVKLASGFLYICFTLVHFLIAELFCLVAQSASISLCIITLVSRAEESGLSSAHVSVCDADSPSFSHFSGQTFSQQTG